MAGEPKCDVVVRPMRPADVEVVLAVERTSFSEPWPRSLFESELSAAGARDFVATLDGAVVGFLCARQVADQVEITNLAVDKGHRREGVASAMMRHALHQLRRDGARAVFLEVRASNAPAQTLYEGFGFERIAVRRGYYSSPVEDAVVLRALLE